MTTTIDLGASHPILERVFIKDWEPETLEAAIGEALQLVTTSQAEGPGGLATAFLRRLAWAARQEPYELCDFLRDQSPMRDFERSHWETLRDLLLDSEVTLEARCAELQRRYIDPTAVLLHFVEVLTEDVGLDNVDTLGSCEQLVHQVSRALLFLGAPAGLRHLVRHWRLLIGGPRQDYWTAFQRSGAAFDTVAAGLFEALGEYDPLGRYTLVTVFEEYGVPCPALREAALRGEATNLSYLQQQFLIDVMMLEPDRVKMKLHSFLDAALAKLAQEPNENSRGFASWAMTRLVFLEEVLSDAQVSAATAVGLHVPRELLAK